MTRNAGLLEAVLGYGRARGPARPLLAALAALAALADETHLNAAEFAGARDDVDAVDIGHDRDALAFIRVPSTAVSPTRTSPALPHSASTHVSSPPIAASCRRRNSATVE